MSVWIVVEGDSDLAILKALLPREIQTSSEFVVGGGRSNIFSVARTLLVKHREPVAMVQDADALDAAAVQEKYQTSEFLLQSVAGSTPFKVILCVPEIEAVFFNPVDILKRIFPKVHFDSYLMFFTRQPKQALAFLYAQGGGPANLAELLDALTEDDVEQLQAAGPIRELITFASEMAGLLGKQSAT